MKFILLSLGLFIMLPYCNNDKENILIARVINKECGYCSHIDKILIASSIINRVNNDSFPNTIEGVIFQKNQYSISKNYTKEDLELVNLILKNKIKDDYVLYFYNVKNSTNKKFIQKMSKRPLITKTKHHEYR